MSFKTAENRGQPSVTALSRGLAILRCFSIARGPLSGSEISRLVQLPQPTVWRLCKTLMEEGYLVRVPGSDKLHPGLRLLGLGYAALSNANFSELARPHMQALASRFNAAIGLCVRDELSMLYVQRCESNAMLRMNLRVGSLIPIATSSNGWALLAGLSVAERQDLLAAMEHEQPDLFRAAREPMFAALDKFSCSGVIINEGVFFPGLNSVALPLFDPVEQIFYTLSCSGLDAIMPVRRLQDEIAPILIETATALQRGLATRSS